MLYDRGDKTIPSAMLGFDDPLLFAVIPDGFTRPRDTARQRCLTDHRARPQLVQQLVFGNDPLTLVEEVHQQVKRLGLNLHPLALAAELIEAIIKLAILEAVQHKPGWAADWPPHTPYTTAVAKRSREMVPLSRGGRRQGTLPKGIPLFCPRGK